MGIRNTSPRNTLQTPIVIGSPTEFDDTFHGDKSSGIPVVLRYTKSNFKKDVKVHIWREPDGQYDDFNHVYPMQHSVFCVGEINGCRCLKGIFIRFWSCPLGFIGTGLKWMGSGLLILNSHCLSTRILL
eukprot:TRINITY_DN4167_c0_g1_i3.p1 TRINITY_DN4167_c0_g1~~TRINITY_DN4167_c0_g1_i3.p1  ORF type:complete len:129 (+),score=12.83 TRINITY_DN4167_c0_g1_i3:79-465(+)